MSDIKGISTNGENFICVRQLLEQLRKLDGKANVKVVIDALEKWETSSRPPFPGK